MLRSTVDALRAVLRTDATVSHREREHLLRLACKRADPQQVEPARSSLPRIVRRGEGAARLGMSLRTFDKLCRELRLKRKLPGRKRAAGVLESDLNDLIAGRTQV